MKQDQKNLHTNAGQWRKVRYLLVILAIGCFATPIWLQWHQLKLNNALISAIRRNDSLNVVQLLKSGAYANARESIPGMRAAIFQLLTHWHYKTKDKRPTALEVLCYQQGKFPNIIVPPDNPVIAKALLANGANPNVHNQTMTPLYYSLAVGNRRTVEVLLEAGADPNLGLIVECVGCCDRDSLNLLIKRGVRVNQHNDFGETPLMVTCKYNNNTAEMLIAAGANVNAISLRGQTALTIAVARQNQNVVDILLAHGANPNLPTADTPLHLAVLAGSNRIVKDLLKHGAEVNKPGNDGRTPLSTAQLLKRSDLTSLLLKHGGRD